MNTPFDKEKLTFVEKPDSIGFDQIHTIMAEAHAGTPEVDYNTTNITEETVKEKIAGGGCVFVALYDGIPVGTMTIHNEQKDKRWYIMGKTASVRYIAVLPSYSGHGIASGLVSACMKWAEDQEVTTVLWDTAFNNVGAVATAEKNDFRKVSYLKFSSVNHPTIRLARWLCGKNPGKIKCAIHYYRDYLKVTRALNKGNT